VGEWGRTIRRDSGVGEEVRGAEGEVMLRTEMQMRHKVVKPGEYAIGKGCGEDKRLCER
jgi:hypothetical protein